MLSKVFSLVVGLAISVSTTVVFAQPKPATKAKNPTTTKSAAGVKKGSAKSTAKTKTSSSAWNPKDKYETELGAPPLPAAEVSGGVFPSVEDPEQAKSLAQAREFHGELVKEKGALDEEKVHLEKVRQEAIDSGKVLDAEQAAVGKSDADAKQKLAAIAEKREQSAPGIEKYKTELRSYQERLAAYQQRHADYDKSRGSLKTAVTPAEGETKTDGEKPAISKATKKPANVAKKKK